MNRPVALLLQTLANDYQELLKDDCLAAARRLGFDVTVFSADRSAERQLQQVREILRQPERTRPVAVLISPVRETTLMAAAYDAMRLGLGWIVLNRWSDYLAEQQRSFPKVPIFCVMPDHEAIGRIQARQIRTAMPAEAELVYIRGPLGTYSAERRWAAFRDEFGTALGQPFLLNSDWSTEGGEQVMREWMAIFSRKQLPTCVVAAQNDAMAYGALKAYGAVARPSAPNRPIVVTGCDGSPGFGVRLVLEKKLTATVIIPPVSGRALHELALMLNGSVSPKLVNLMAVESYPDLPTLAHGCAKERGLSRS